MAKRAISIMLTEAEDRKLVEDFMSDAFIEHRRASAAQTELTDRSTQIINHLSAKHGVASDVEMYVDTMHHANHGLLFLASVAYASDDVPTSAGRVLN